MPLSFEELAEREPALKELELIVKYAHITHRRADGGFCANAVWYGYARPGGKYYEESIKGKMEALVGRHSQHSDPELHTSAAYDTAYFNLYEGLPPCDHEDGTTCGWGYINAEYQRQNDVIT